jgi:hypothetical protein
VSVASKIVRCCVQCNECGDCYTHSLYDLRDLMMKINYQVANYGAELAQRVNWGYGCITITENEVKKLLLLKNTIRRYYDGIRQKAMSCLCDTDFQKIKEQVLRIIGIRKCTSPTVADIRYDYSGYDDWVVKHPNCVAYDVWEKGTLVKLAPSFRITATHDEKVIIARTLHAMSTKDDCVIKLLAYAYKAKCDHKISVSAKSEEKCKTEFKILSKKHKCDFNLKVYSKLLACNLSFRVVSQVLACGGKISLDENGAPIVRIGAKSAKIDDVAKLASGLWPVVNDSELNEMYS